MVTKSHDLTDAVTYRVGTFPPPTLDDEVLRNAQQALAEGAPLGEHLIRTAIAHVEFEALRPFQDGDGRIGRMLITLILWSSKSCHQPNFFVSGYFKAHKAGRLPRRGKRADPGRAVDNVFARPVFRNDGFVDRSGKPPPPARYSPARPPVPMPASLGCSAPCH